MKIVETSRCGVSMFFIAVGWTAAASAGQAPLSLPGCCLAGRCRRSGSLLPMKKHKENTRFSEKRCIFAENSKQ